MLNRDHATRTILIASTPKRKTRIDWGDVSVAIFAASFMGVMMWMMVYSFILTLR